MKSVRQACKPRGEVLKGDLEDTIFGADFGHVVEGRAPKVYQDPKDFFRNTHPATSLKKVITTIFERLAAPNESGAAVRLSTGYGGGKTHTLIALWHLAQNISKTTFGNELLPAAGRPQKVVVAGIDASKFLETKSLWGELALKLSGKTGYAKIKSMDNPTTVPNAAMVREMLPDAPVLILLDELVIYMASLNEQERGALLGFLNLLIAEVGARKQAVVVITDPAGQPTYQKEAEELANATKQFEAAQRLDGVLGRKVSDFDPIGDEAAQVIIRRLFEKVDKNVSEEVSAEYFNTYKRVVSEYPDLLPLEAATLEYANRIVECYPFHPRLLETAQNRLGALQDFQKSRGTLRLFARILRDIWDDESEILLITAGDLNWKSDRIQADLLQRLNRDNFKPAVDADVVQHAGKLNVDFSTDVHRRVASALLLESLPLNENAAMDKRDLTLAVLHPSDVGHEPGEAIDRLMSVCWHTYKDNSGRKFQFRYDPNANKIIEERAENILFEDAKQAVRTLAQNYFKGHIFTPVAYPSSPRAVSDSAALKLVLCDTEQLAQVVCDYENDSDPEAKRPRRFRNAIFGIAPTLATLHEAVRAMRLQMAAEEVVKEYKKKTPLKEQVEELFPALRRRVRIRMIRAFNRVVFQGKPSVTLTEKYLVSEDSVLESVNGQAKLKEFLDDNKLVYQPNDALDVDLLLEIMKGATPSLDHEGAYPANAVHERTLAYDKLRLMMNESPVRNAILKAVEQGKLVVRYSNNDAYDDKGCVTGAQGNRGRRANKRLTTIQLTSDVLLAPSSAPCVSVWTKVEDKTDTQDNVLGVADAAVRKNTTAEEVADAIESGNLNYVIRDGSKMVMINEQFHQWQPSSPKEVSALTWGEAISHAAKRPLHSLTFWATKPDVAKTLIGLAQPFGAKSITLSVMAGGKLKDGGIVNFNAKNLKYNHALKPIDVATTLLRAMSDDATFESQLTLDFGDDGLKDATSKFEQAQDKAADDVRLEAKFGKEDE